MIAIMAIILGEHKEIDVNGTVELLTNAKKVTIIPGYGLAVAKAQYASEYYYYYYYYYYYHQYY